MLIPLCWSWSESEGEPMERNSWKSDWNWADRNGGNWLLVWWEGGLLWKPLLQPSAILDPIKKNPRSGKLVATSMDTSPRWFGTPPQRWGWFSFWIQKQAVCLQKVGSWAFYCKKSGDWVFALKMNVFCPCDCHSCTANCVAADTDYHYANSGPHDYYYYGFHWQHACPVTIMQNYQNASQRIRNRIENRIWRNNIQGAFSP